MGPFYASVGFLFPYAMALLLVALVTLAVLRAGTTLAPYTSEPVLDAALHPRIRIPGYF